MQIIGHRGARGEAPENTLGGFKYLHDLGVRAVEFDVRQLADTELSVIHDDNFLRTAGIDYQVKDCTQQDTQRFNQIKGWEFWHQTEPLPLLRQVMHVLKDFQHIEVEVKSVKNEKNAEKIVHTLQQQLQHCKDHITITSFDLKILKALQSQQSDFKRGLLVEMPIGEHAIDIATQFNCQRIGWKNELVNESIVKLSRQAKLDVSVWTVNDIDRAKTLQDFGIQGLITDYPKRMLQHLSPL
ncbi:glycerophosphodiester phosphodiesterase [Acinetobacter qingfengensis]|uniref:Glycerophosphodiester phosphodiesterase n=1 Tax=Acinetobacter qingfengensis TaxID=1262585 RepID=A0A1E7QXH3_9GAMM|nr:glycerophosphodiester phosphodiesterase [Acinetobacter qingfengensis]KAA8731648.1 glycerophosphodiester phosphodiesterase [Acinetobacter qingfengensis]OEY91751.1 glycerophosphodiester phosphodiesterase [Acinetobacter qingfengensis]